MKLTAHKSRAKKEEQSSGTTGLVWTQLGKLDYLLMAILHKLHGVDTRGNSFSVDVVARALTLSNECKEFEMFKIKLD